MEDINRFTGEYVHDLFCQLLECEKMEGLEIVGFDDLSYFNKLQAEGIEDENIPSHYKANNDGSFTMYVNEDELNLQPYHAFDVLLSQLFNIYSGTLSFYEPAYMEAHKFWFFKSAPVGYEHWFNFSCSYMSFKLLSDIFGLVDEDEESTEDELREKYCERYNEALKEIIASDNNSEDKISAMLYIFGKLAYLDNIPADNIHSMLQLRKVKFFDLANIVEGEVGKEMADIYKILAKSILMPLEFHDYMNLAKKTDKLKILLSAEENKK